MSGQRPSLAHARRINALRAANKAAAAAVERALREQRALRTTAEAAAQPETEAPADGQRAVRP